MQLPVDGVNLDLVSVNHDNQFLDIHRENAIERHAFRLTFKGTPPSGDFYDTVEFRPRNTEDVVRVPVSARIRDRVSVAPSNVVLRPSGDAGYEPISIILASTSGDIDLTKMRLGDNSKFRINRCDPLDKRRYRIELVATRDIGEEYSELQLIVSDTESVTLRVFANRAPAP